jgi:ABC-2 type transport system ATP-binding protein
MARRNFWDVIYTLAAGGTTIFVTTHYMEEAEYCNRLALMNRGNLIALDTPAGLRARMKEPLLEVECNDSVRAIGILERAPSVVRAGLYGRMIHVTVSDERRGTAEIRDLLTSNGLTVTKIERIEPSLEDVFISLVEATGGALVG